MNALGIAKRSARAVVRRALAIPPLRRLVESELQHADRRATPPVVAALPIFIDRRGVAHHLDPTLRDRLKPNWRVMCEAATASAAPTDAGLRDRLRRASKTAIEVEHVLGATLGVGLSGRILEIGCYDGSTAFELARRPGTSVVASDLARYYAVQRPGQPEAEAIAAEEASLDHVRERVRVLADRPPRSVMFIEDDITTSSLEPGTFDLIVSFEVLEHLQRPDDAFAAIARLLKPGGTAYHDYNPFFSMIGGHSLVTLDMPWGHARLDDGDVERYLAEIRPTEAEQATRFYRESLNRMTLAHLQAAITGAGLELVAFLPWYQRKLLEDITPNLLEEVHATYPGVTIDDLIATFVTVVARRPSDAEAR